MSGKHVIGIDFGTDSVRSVVVDTTNGAVAATAVFEYPRWRNGLYCDPATNMFRQHPLDFTEGLEVSVRESLKGLGPGAAKSIAAISVDTTGSTPVAVDRNGIPLALKKGFEDDPDAMFILWKDHTANKEAAEINELARTWGGTDFTIYSGGSYSPEWFWSKILHVLRRNKNVRTNAWSWMELCDWIPALLTGNTDPLEIKRSRCAAGHKAMWHKDFGGLPDEKFLVKLDPLLTGIRERLYVETYTTDTLSGTISKEWSEKLGLPENVRIGVGTIDAHAGAVGIGIKPFHLVKVMGTSTCDLAVAPGNGPLDKPVRGICGQVDGSILPGLTGFEAGQSAFGDIYAWFGNILMWPVIQIISKMTWLDEESRQRIREETAQQIISRLSSEAANIPDEETSIIALDWMNGRRTPDSNPWLKGAITGLTLGSDAPKIFKALVEASAFGSKVINDRLVSEGIRINGVIASGGVAQKNSYVMQTVTDVLNMPIKVSDSVQPCALGSAIAASVVAGIYENIPEAQKYMGGGVEKEYNPDPVRAGRYQSIFRKYMEIGTFIENNL